MYLPVKPDELEEAIANINSELNNVSVWARSNSLALNPCKTQSILFYKNEIDTENYKIYLDNSEVMWSNVVKNLGLYMDRTLSFDAHVNQICRSAYYKLRTIYEFKHDLPEEAKQNLTEALILSIPNFCDCVYGSFITLGNKYKIQKIQNSCARYVKCLTRSEHISGHVAALFRTDMEQRRYIHLCCFIHKIVTTKTPTYLYELIVWRRDIHNVNVRNSNAVHIPKHKTEFFKSSFLYQMANVYNQLPTEMFNLSSQQFRNKIHQLVVSS